MDRSLGKWLSVHTSSARHCISSLLLGRALQSLHSSLDLSKNDLLESHKLSPSLIHQIAQWELQVPLLQREILPRARKMAKHWASLNQKKISVTQAAQWIFQTETPSPIQLMTAYQCMLTDTITYQVLDPVEPHLLPRFQIRDPSELAMLFHAYKEARAPPAPNSPLSSFLQKCAARMEASRKGLLAAPISFSRQDHVYISILKRGAAAPLKYRDIYRTLSSLLVLRNLPFPSKDAFASDIVVLLKELGVLAPWSNGHLYKTGFKDLAIGRNLKTDQCPVTNLADAWASHVLDQGAFVLENTKILKKASRDTPEPTINMKEFAQKLGIHPGQPMVKSSYAKDTCEHLRHDFGNLPVYVIDDPTAHELDDGISIEESPKGPWIHVHIADPTAILPPTHPLSLIAQARCISLYLPEQNFPMMPDVLSDKLFNLGHSPLAMTFSARLNEQGDIVDYKVVPSIIQNIKKITYQNADGMLKWDHVYGMNLPEPQRSPWIQGLIESRAKEPITLTEDALQLQKLQALVQKHLEYRVANGSISGDRPELALSLSPYPLPRVPSHLTKPLEFPLEAFPSITVNPITGQSSSPSHQMVAECMIIAGRVAALYCQDRKIPTLYRGQDSVLDTTHPDLHSSIQNILDQRDPKTGKIGYTQFFGGLVQHFSTAHHDTQPISHWSMGISDKMGGYTRVTSPLRRYMDMVSHWNIKQQLIDPQRPLYKFSQDKIMEMAPTVSRRETAYKVLSRHTLRTWALEWMRRRQVFFKDQDGWTMPPDSSFTKSPEFERTGVTEGPVYDAIVTRSNPDTAWHSVMIPSLGGIAASMKLGPGKLVEPGMRLSVHALTIQPERGHLIVSVD